MFYNIPMEKICKACAQAKPLDQFPKDRSRPDGHNFYCKPCSSARTKMFAMRPPRRTPPPGLKWCGRCKQDKPIMDFHASVGTYDGLQKKCKACSRSDYNGWRKDNLGYVAQKMREARVKSPERFRDYGRKSRYGLEPGEYGKMLAAQSGVCAICKGPATGMGEFHVDHCHETGIVRGLLCHGCNVSLGHFNHDEKILQAAIEYLRVKR